VEMQKVPVTSDVLDGSMGADLDESIKGGRAPPPRPLAPNASP